MGTDWVSPAGDTEPPTLTIESPQKNMIINSNNVTLNFNARVGESETATYTRLMQVFYKTDWEQNETYVYNNEGINLPYEPNAITEFSYSVDLPEPFQITLVAASAVSVAAVGVGLMVYFKKRNNH